MSLYIIKASGEKELFDIKKIASALRKAGASEGCIEELTQKILAAKNITSTADIYEYVAECLATHEPVAASRYNIKRGLMQLGPAGYPFEQYVGKLFEAQDYKVTLNKMAEGWCVRHELDVVAVKGEEHFMIECKFHKRMGLKTNVKVALYIKARFDDMHKQWENDKNHGHDFHQAWIVTNTRFTSEAIKFANCTNINLLGWSYPNSESLPELITRLGVYPVTVLSGLNQKQKKLFLSKGLVLCRDVLKHKALLKQGGMNHEDIEQLCVEIKALCAC